MTLDELDRLAAEKVMGWEFHTWTRQNGSILEDWWCAKGDPCAFETRVDKWRPTRKISQAWECLEKNNWNWTFDRSWYDGPHFTIRINHEGEQICEGYADNASEAIVRACLKAKGVEL